MPPKRGQKPSTQTRSKKRKTTSGILESTPPVPMDADLQINTQPTSAIDYDKLALAILKHSAPANEIPATPALIACSNTPGPSSMSSPQDSLPSSTGLGDLLDKVFTGGNDGDLSVGCTASTASTTRSTRTTISKTSSTTSTTPLSTTTTILKSIQTTTTPSIHSTSFIDPSKEATVRNNMNTDVITNSKETASVSFSSPTMKTTPDDSQKRIYIIAGFALGAVIILIGLIPCILAPTKRGKIERTKDKSTEDDSAPTNKNADSSNALRENPLYVSSDEVEDIKCTEEKSKQQGEGYSSATDLESNRDHDDGPSINQPVDSIPVFPHPNNSNRSHSRRDVYAQVYKQNKSSATVHDIVQTQNQNSLFFIGIE